MNEEEEIVSCLEEIDKTFSNINRVFKEIQIKMENVRKSNNDIVNNLNPWIRFFDLEKSIEKNSSTSYSKKSSEKFKEESEKTLNIVNNDSSIIQASPIRNPFLNNNVEEKVSLVSKLHSSFANMDEVIEESEFSSLIDFDIELLPEAFRVETEIINLHSLIKENGKMAVKSILSKYESEEDQQKIGIFLEILIRKKILKFIDGYLYAKSK